MQRGSQPLGRYGAGEAERAPDVMVMDERLDQAYSAAELGGAAGDRQAVRAAAYGLCLLYR